MDAGTNCNNRVEEDNPGPVQRKLDMGPGADFDVRPTTAPQPRRRGHQPADAHDGIERVRLFPVRSDSDNLVED